MDPNVSGDNQVADLNAQAPSATNTDVNQPAAPSSGQDVTNPVSSNGSADTAAPSAPSATDKTNAEPESMADAIAQAFEQMDKPDAAKNADGTAKTSDTTGDAAKTGDAKTGEEPGTNTDDGAATQDLPDPTPEELAALPPNSRKRVGQLLRQRAGLRQEVAALQAPAESYRTIRNFMQENDLADQEVADLFQMGAHLKSGDPKRLQAFLERVEPLIQTAREALGRAIPADLRPKIDSGEVTEEVAQEIARTRYAASQAQASAERADRRTEAVQVTQTQQQIRQTMTDWTAQKRASDPDFNLKSDAMALAAQALVARHGLPRTTAEAVQYAQTAYQQADAMIRKVRPGNSPAATRPTPGNTTASPPRANAAPAEPKSLADVIGQALGSFSQK